MAKRWSAGDKPTAAEVNDSVVPTGAIMPYAGLSAPTDWLLCDGSAVSRTTYSVLFALLGSLYGDGDGSTTFNLPNLSGCIPIGKNSSVKTVLDNCDAAWTAGANVTATNDTGDKKEGTGSVKLAVAAGAGAAQILGYKAISSANLSGKTRVGIWIKSSIALNSGDLKYQMDDTAALASPIESIDIPALAANVWTKVYLVLATPHLDTAIISHGIYQVVDKGAFNLWIDDINFGEYYEVGAMGGESSHVLKTAELAAHTHAAAQNNVGAGGPYQSGTYGGGISSSGSAGGDLAHNNLPPFLTVLYIIKA